MDKINALLDEIYEGDLPAIARERLLSHIRAALTMRLDEQPGESNARSGSRPAAREPARAANPAKGRGKPAPAGNSAMGDALAAAFGKKR
ncbi:hypothetical protein CRX72_26950 [Pantoea sp. BRM17]|nr:hypothetical protein CRX72_26950 [Pantoea sp. BRM17]